LWNDPDGRGQGNVDRTAFTLAPGGFLAVTPDGSIVERAPFPMLRYEVRRARASLRVGAMLAALYVAAIAIGLVRHTIGWLKWPALPARAGRLRKPGTGTRRRVVVTARRWPPAAAGRSRTSNDEAA
jgi:hypothetical protein